VFNRIGAQLERLLSGAAGAVVVDSRFGEVSWTFEEYAFLDTVYEKEAFYREMDGFLSAYIPDAAFRREMLAYQAFTVKEVGRPYTEFTGGYDWLPYFRSLQRNRKAALQKRPVRYAVTDAAVCATWPEYARKVVWYGRRGGKNLYSSEIGERPADA
jgi:hypothetical protein